MSSVPQPSEITTRLPEVDFTSRFVQPPSLQYVFRDDRLFIRSQSSIVDLDLNIRGRLLTPNGEIVTLEFAHRTSATARQATLDTFALQEGFFLSLIVHSPATSPERGETYVIAGIARGGDDPGTITQLFFADYLEGLKSPSWPLGRIESSVAGPGRIYTTPSTNPAAGAEISHTVPDNVRWRLISMRYTLVTDVTVANRISKVDISSGGSQVWRASADTVQTASTTVEYSAGRFGGTGSGLGGVFLVPLPNYLILPAGATIATVTDALQAGDDYGAADFLVEEWIIE